MNKIVFLTTNYYSEIDFLRIGLNAYYRNKISVELWYLNKLVKKDHDKREFYFKNNKIKIKKITNFSNLENLLRKNTKHCLYYAEIAYNFENRKIFQYLSKYGTSFIFYLRYPKTIYQSEFRLINYLKHQLKYNFRKLVNFRINNIKKVFLNKLFFLFDSNFWNIKKARYVYLIGKYAYLNRKSHKLFGNNTKIIWGQLRNYDDFLREGKNNFSLKKKKALFIDQAPYGSPLLELDLTDIRPADYYKSIGSFLTKLNKEFGYEIEISSHPRVNINKINKFFPNFKIGIGQTIKQIKNSNLIICHYSTSFTYAVLYNKPIIFITNDCLNNSAYPHYEEIYTVAKLLNKKCLNIDRNSVVDTLSNLKVNKKVYKKYLENFVKYKSPKKFQSYLIINKLKQDKFWI